MKKGISGPQTTSTTRTIITTTTSTNKLRTSSDKIDVVNPLLALKNFKAGSYDLLIIDIVMPEMDGFSLYEEIRKIDNKVKVCFITAFEMNYQALRAVFPAATTTDDMDASSENQLIWMIW
ncbi:MAG: response regulator [Candidatus Nitrosopolaris sp.]